jgi:hypothetical protein
VDLSLCGPINLAFVWSAAVEALAFPHFREMKKQLNVVKSAFGLFDFRAACPSVEAVKASCSG